MIMLTGLFHLHNWPSEDTVSPSQYPQRKLSYSNVVQKLTNKTAKLSVQVLSNRILSSSVQVLFNTFSFHGTNFNV